MRASVTKIYIAYARNHVTKEPAPVVITSGEFVAGWVPYLFKKRSKILVSTDLRVFASENGCDTDIGRAEINSSHDIASA